MKIDHLAVTVADLEAGVAEIEAALGVTLAQGGRHDAMGSWNRLLALGPDCYLEVIAPDPSAPPPGRARWFGLDAAPLAPRLSHWIARTDDIERAAAELPMAGRVLDLARGDLRWRITVPDDGQQPWDGVAPALIEWPEGAVHPAASLPDSGCTLSRLELVHPDAGGLQLLWPFLNEMPGVEIRAGRTPALRAVIDTPAGQRVLG